MSIFRSSFRDYVKKQLNVRRLITSRGATTNNAPDFYEESDAVDRNLGYNFNPAGLDLDMEAGAFYTYTHNKSCVIRMTSMTDYVEDVGIDIGLERPLSEGGDYTRPFKTIKGATLARNFVLQGGVLSDFATNAGDGQRKVKQGKDVRGGFPQSGKTLNTSYGDASIGANNSDDGYGIVPMPGIVDAAIRTKSAYGSLREAKVNFVVHSRRQLEVLEMLYMRPGYAVLLEWGWSPYINNKGKIESSLNVVQDEIGEDVLFSNQVTQDLLFQTVKQLKESQDGNYDGMLGYVKNFGFSQSNEGAYNCFIELISLGEVLDSLVSTSPTISTTPVSTGSLGDFSDYDIHTLPGLINSLDLLSDKFAQQNIDYRPPSEDFNLIDAYEGLNDITPLQRRQIITDQISEYLFNPINNDGLEFNSRNPISNYFISFVKNYNENDNYSATGKTYIRLDALFHSINRLCIPPNEGNYTPTFLSPDKIVDTDNPDEIYIQPLLYNNYPHPDGSLGAGDLKILDGSTDVSVCVMPHQLKSNQALATFSEGNYSRLDTDPLYRNILSAKRSANALNISEHDFVTEYFRYFGDGRIPTYMSSEGIINPVGTNTGNTLSILDPVDERRRIGSIFVSIDTLQKSLNSQNPQDTSIGEFIKNVLEAINGACPLHNFVLSDDNEAKYSYVYDLGIDLGTTPSDDNLYEFQPGTNQTTVRDYDIQSTVPSSLSSTIAIQAQDPRGVNNIDGVTFKAFNRSIKNRLLSVNTEPLETTVEQLGDSIRRELQNDVAKIDSYNEYIWFHMAQKATERTVGVEEVTRLTFDNYISSHTNMSSTLTRATNNISILLTEAFKSPSTAAVIPLSVNMTIDGIGGIVKGHMFKIEPDRLPKAYEKSNIGFITFGEEQMISVGGDWTTKLEGKMTLLANDDETRKKLKQGIVPGFQTPTQQTQADQQVAMEELEALLAGGARPITLIRNNGQVVNEIFTRNHLNQTLEVENIIKYYLDSPSSLYKGDILITIDVNAIAVSGGETREEETNRRYTVYDPLLDPNNTNSDPNFGLNSINGGVNAPKIVKNTNTVSIF